MNEIDAPLFPNIDLLQTALEAALSAGKAIMTIYRTNFDIDYKSDFTPVTLADTTADKIITKILSTSGIPVISEESETMDYARRKSWKMLWMVDPLDGTKEFIRGRDEFTVNIALILGQKPVLGVVYAPATGELYFGMTSIGSFLTRLDLNVETELLSPSEIMASSEKLPLRISKDIGFVVQASRSHQDAKTRRFINELKQSHPDLRVVARGSSLKLCAVADGSCHVYPRFGPTMEWDTAAGHAIIIQVGGDVTEVKNGFPLSYNKKSLQNPDFIAKR